MMSALARAITAGLALISAAALGGGSTTSVDTATRSSCHLVQHQTNAQPVLTLTEVTQTHVESVFPRGLRLRGGSGKKSSGPHVMSGRYRVPLFRIRLELTMHHGHYLGFV